MVEGTTTTPRPASREAAVRANRWAYRVARCWLAGFTVLFGLYVGLPFLAPLFMWIGWEGPASVIYSVYSFLCHQLPQRSYFLFGGQFSASLADIQSAWVRTDDPMLLRRFVGTPQMGWKVAWSDRMVWMYTSMLLFAWIWYPLRRRIPGLSWRGLLVLLLPMTVDGLTHMVSDIAGLGQGFRDTNTWLAAMTGSALPASFYAGDAWGSFNATMRLMTGILFGAGVVWFAFPYFDEYFTDYRQRIEDKFRRAGLWL